MREVELTNSDKVALVDDEDFERVAKHRWLLMLDGYVKCSTRMHGKQPRLHRFILSTPEGSDTDHVNHDLLDNRRKNLRIATTSQNMANRLKDRDETSSIFKGVCWHKRIKKWQANIRFHDRLIHLGYFNSQEEAARAYDRAALKQFGEFARVNF